MDVPAGGLSRFLRQNLRFKVFLVAISILEDRWATRTRTSITTRDLHEARVCVRIIVDHMVRLFFLLFEGSSTYVRF